MTKCLASPCDIIRAINAERDRTCDILERFKGQLGGMYLVILDEIHGVDYLPTPPEKKEDK